MTTSYIYDSLDRVVDVRYPKQYPQETRKLVHHDYDVASRLTSLTVDGQTQASEIVYNSSSQTTQLKVGAAGANQVTENSIALQSDGKIALGGLIVLSSVPTLITTPVTRLNPNGSFDSSFNPGTINSNLYKVVVQPDGKILMGGFFTTINGTTRRYLARLNSDGSLDNSFDASAEATAPIYALYLKTDGKILFSNFVITPSGSIAKQLNANGSLDRTFVPSQAVSGTIYTLISNR
jgi:uncharacterized delta-60 repeat protein